MPAEAARMTAVVRERKSQAPRSGSLRLPLLRDCGSHSMSARSAACAPECLQKGCKRGRPERRTFGAFRD